MGFKISNKWTNRPKKSELYLKNVIVRDECRKKNVMTERIGLDNKLYVKKVIAIEEFRRMHLNEEV